MSKPERLLYSKSEAAAMLNISQKTLLAEVRSGNLRFVLIGARRFFALSDLDEFIDSRRQGWPSEGARGRAIGTTTSRSSVLAFEAALKRRTGKKREPTRRRPPKS